jgi:outer membrane receptor protein involved in Fe transport
MSKFTRVLTASASAIALLSTAPAFAQDADEDVIIISATKRNTTLQDTPVAVTVTSADVIENAQILDIKDLQSVVPTFRVSQLQNAANSTLIIRGFGNGGNNIGIEPSVGLFIDGVYRSRAAAQIVDLPNLDRIEVLSGPQSTLFGKNASAGVVSVVTSAPEYEANGYIEGGVGNYGLNYAKGYLTGGLSDTLAVSLGAGYQKRDGYFEPSAGSGGGDFNDLNRFNIRAQALWDATENLSFRAIWDKTTLDENCCGVTTAVVGPTAGIIGALGGQVPSPNDPFSYETAQNRATTNLIDDGGASLTIEYGKDWLGGLTFTSITSKRENETDYESDSDFTTAALLDNVFQFVDIDTFTQEFRVASNNGSGLEFMLGAYYFDESIDQDAGLLYGADLRNYIDALASIDPATGVPATFVSGPSASPLFGFEQVLGFETGTFFAEGQRIDERFQQENEAYSFFGTTDFDLTDRLTLSLGGNYTKDKKDVQLDVIRNEDVFSNLTLTGAQGTQIISTGLFLDGNAAAGVPSFEAALGIPFTPANFQNAASGAFGPAAQGYVNGVLGASAGLAADEVNGPLAGLLGLQFQPLLIEFPNAVESGRTRDSDTSYTAKLGYEVNDNINVFVSTGTGFKASSFNLTRDTRPFRTDATALGNAGLLANNNYNGATGRNFGTRFSGPEEVTVYELGLKTRFDWGAINIVAYDQTIENFQSTIFQGTGFVLANAGEQTSRGVEFDSTFKPVEGLTLGFAGIIQDPEFVDFQGAPVITGGELDLANQAPGTPGDGVGDLSGTKPAGINEVALSVSASYEMQLSDNLNAFIRGDYQYEDEVQVVGNIPGVTRETSLFNAALGFEYDGYALRLWGRNILNDESFTSAFPGVVQAGTVNAYPNQPRTYGVALRKTF